MTQPQPSKVSTIDPERDVVTLINTFTVKPEKQRLFIEAQIGEYKRLSGKIASALAANLHRGRSGHKAVNYAQFRTVEELRGWQASDLMKEHLPVIQPHMERAQPGLYRVVEVVSRSGRAAHIEESETSGRIALIVVIGRARRAGRARGRPARGGAAAPG